MGLDSSHSAYGLLEELKTRNAAVIDKLCAIKEEESLYLEYKEKQDSNSPELSSNDKDKLGKILSGFSNSDGGIAIWGITNEKLNGRDVAGKPLPIADIEQFISTLQDLSVKWLTPKNIGIEIFSILTKEDASKGFAVVVVPQGDSRPYMSNAPGHKKFFQKTSTNIVDLERFQIQDLFNTNVSPSLELVKTVQQKGYSNTIHTEYDVRFWIRNSGTVPAEHPYIWLSYSTYYNITPISPFHYPNVQSKDTRTKLFAPANYMIFPDDTIWTSAFTFHSRKEQGKITYYFGAAPGYHESEPKRRIVPITIDIWYGSKNSIQRQCREEFSEEIFRAELSE